MNCNFAMSRMSCFVDGELPGDEMIALRRHLEACPPCREVYESERAAKKLLSALPEREASPDFEGRLLAAVRAATGSSEAPVPFWPTGRTVLAMGLAAVAVFCVFLVRGTDSAGQSPVGHGNEVALDQDWNDARSVFPASNLPAGLQGP